MKDRRSFFRSGLHDIYKPFYDSLCSLLDQKWQPYSGFRSFDDQEKLYAKGRSIPGSAVTNAKGGESAHNYGCASDWTIFDDKGNPEWLKKEDPLWDEYKTAIWKSGLRAGADFGDVDHNEYPIDCSWKRVKAVYDVNGIDGAMGFIEVNQAKIIN